MRLRLSTIRQQSKNPTAMHFQQVSLALLRLYLPDDTNYRDAYRDYSKGTKLLEHCANGTLNPVDNETQSAIATMFPREQIAHLYLRGWAAPEPSHYVVLHKDESTGLFRVRCNRVCSVTLGEPLKKDGVLMQWDTQDPEVAAIRTPSLSRIYGGGSTSIAHNIQTDLEVQREISLSLYTLSLFRDTIHEVSIWMPTAGKVVIQPTASPAEPFCDLHQFNLLRTRPYVPMVTKPNCIIRAVPTLGYAPEGFPHIVPQIKEAEPFETTDKPFGRFLTAALETRLLPFVGVQEDKKVSIYAFSYFDRDEDGLPSLIADNKLPGVCGTMPLVTLAQNGDSARFVPNGVLAATIQYHMLNSLGNEGAFKLRFRACKRLMAYFGYKDFSCYARAFQEWRMPLTQGQIAVMMSMEDMAD